jgi:hypothetical protein
MTVDVCAECGGELETDPWTSRRRFGPRYCSPRCRYRARDRRRHAEDPERQRAKSRAYYAANRAQVLER